MDYYTLINIFEDEDISSILLLSKREWKIRDIEERKISDPLTMTVWTGQYNLFLKLLDKKTGLHNYDFHTGSALGYSCVKGKIDFVRALLENGISPDNGGVYSVPEKDGSFTNPLMFAIFSGHTEVAKELLNFGANIEHRDKLGHTALGYACIRNNFEIMEELLNRGANIDYRDKEDMTILTCICGDHDSIHLKTVQYLLDRGADINSKDDIGFTPLMNACNCGSTDIFYELLNRGADMNLKTIYGGTALLYSARSGNIHLTKELLNRGANPDILDKEGKTFLDFIEDEEKRKEIKIYSETLSFCKPAKTKS